MKVAFLALTLFSVVEGRTVVVTGATGHTGSQVYLALKSQGFTVRGFVRNVTKARKYLGCDKCDESEGIFVGDVRNGSTMVGAMTGADTLVIGTGPAYKCKIPSIFIGCKYYPGADPKTMSWLSVKTQVSTFASSSGPAVQDRHVTLLSNTLTTQPDNMLDKIDNGHGCFYGLQGEAFLMGSGVPYTVIKAAGLTDGDASKLEIVVGHDDQGWAAFNPNEAYIRRSDISRLLTYAAANPNKTQGLRFDVTSKRIGGKPTLDVSTVFEAAEYAWDPRSSNKEVVV